MRQSLLVVAVVVLVVAGSRLVVGSDAPRWVGTWTASPAPFPSPPRFKDQTVREIVHVSIGGDRLRLRLANTFGDQPLLLQAVHVGVRSTGASIVPGSDRTVTFSGRPSNILPPGTVGLSDPVSLSFPPAADLAVSIYLSGSVVASTSHWVALQTSYVNKRGDMTDRETFPVGSTILYWPFLTAVSVSAPEQTLGIVALGDSITDGASSTIDTNHRWPEPAGGPLAALCGRPAAVMNAGIGGNRILHGVAHFGNSALARFDRDVLVQPGLTDVIVFEGINDIGLSDAGQAPALEAVSADDIIAGLYQLAERAHERGVRVFGATIGPFEGAGGYTPAGEAKRQAVNAWLRSSHVFDATFDFDLALRDPDRPSRLLPANDSGDHLHPSDAGHQAMADAIDLSIFR